MIGYSAEDSLWEPVLRAEEAHDVIHVRRVEGLGFVDSFSDQLQGFQAGRL